MVKAVTLHKIAGIGTGLVLLLLGITGFFLDHKQWDFLYTTTFKHLPKAALEEDKRLFEAYWQDPVSPKHNIIGGKRGIFETFDGGATYRKMSNIQCQAIKDDKNKMFAATSDGIYVLKDSIWSNYALSGEYVNALCLSPNDIVAVVDKREIVRLTKTDAQILGRSSVKISSSKLQEAITLSRLVRDLHYGRGLLEGDWSLYINDYGALFLTALAFGGYLIWWLIHKKKAPKVTRKLIRLHSNVFSLAALIPLVILAVTGVFLDHANTLARFMASVKIPHAILPPVYSTLQHDIWSVDFDGKIYRIGNRYGVYKSEDLRDWEMESKGFAFRMIRKDNVLYVSGMGSSNRKYDGRWERLNNTPHMFRDVVNNNGKISYFAATNDKFTLPVFKDATLYSLFFTLHDGTFFASWWIWINDISVLAFFVLGATGVIRWYKRRRSHIKKKIPV
ncbi:PepSY-associated TM helix domain-containing protein [Sulfurimonas sp. HSL-1716]|uniref:PepSY-associated TM helix domain-containing protein n=1 Tax=Hydrocurvibacter sulfurireducens TaxID=3131937 RepID=UPI0031FA4549